MIESIQELLIEYKRRHSDYSNDICSRKYIVGYYHCPAQIGNRMFEFMNSFAIAVITNRTLLWKFCSGLGRCPHSTAELCDPYIAREIWINSFDDWATEYSRTCGKLNSGHKNDLYSLLNSKQRRVSVEAQTIILSCAGIDEIDDILLDVGVMENFQTYFTSFRNSNLGPEALYRSKVLFSLGAEYAYGLLFSNAFHFTDTTIAMNNALLHSSQLSTTGHKHNIDQSLLKNAHVIGVHLRHQRSDDLGDEDHGEASCLRHLVNSSQQQENSGSRAPKKIKTCVVLLASDRPMSVTRNSKYLEALNCKVVSRPFHSNYTVEAGEHGPSGDGVEAIADIELLSRSRVFLGQRMSSFSYLIASLVRYNSVKHKMPYSSNTYNCLQKLIENRDKASINGDEVDTYWLPSCERCDAGALQTLILSQPRSLFWNITNTRSGNSSDHLDIWNPNQWNCSKIAPELFDIKDGSFAYARAVVVVLIIMAPAVFFIYLIKPCLMKRSKWMESK